MIVKADHLEASQAVSIIDLVSDALDVKAASIQGQYRNEMLKIKSTVPRAGWRKALSPCPGNRLFCNGTCCVIILTLYGCDFWRSVKM